MSAACRPSPKRLGAHFLHFLASEIHTHKFCLSEQYASNEPSISESAFRFKGTSITDGITLNGHPEEKSTSTVGY